MDIYEKRRAKLADLIALDYEGNQAEFSRRTGFKSPQINRWLSTTTSDRRNITESSARKIEEKANKPRYWLDGKPEIRANVSEKIPLGRRVPLISYVAAGNWSEAVDNFAPGNADVWIDTTITVRKHTYALRVQGDSMEPKFPDGAIIIIEPEEEARNGSFVIVRQNGTEATFKQLVYDGAQAYLKPMNSRYPIMPMLPDAVICGVVKQMVMDV
jgi:SOS-response transcriptional repressor LexA